MNEKRSCCKFIQIFNSAPVINEYHCTEGGSEKLSCAWEQSPTLAPTTQIYQCHHDNEKNRPIAAGATRRPRKTTQSKRQERVAALQGKGKHTPPFE